MGRVALDGGDRLLRNLVGILRSYLPDEAILARSGDNEFGVLIENSTLDNAFRIAETLRRAISNYRSPIILPKDHPAVSGRRG